MGTVWRVGRVPCVADCDLPQLGGDLASSRTCCHMELPAATKATDANFVRVSAKRFNESRLSQTIL